MKHIVRYMIVCMCLLSSAGCVGGEPVGNAPPRVDPTDLDALTEAYIAPFDLSSPMWTDRSWYGLEDINPDHIVQVCADKNYLDLTRDWEGVYEDYNQPADLVEAAIREHFDVSSHYLRQSQLYNPETDTYQLLARGSGWYVIAVSAQLEETLLTIDLNVNTSDGYLPSGGKTDATSVPYSVLALDVSDPLDPLYLSYEITYIAP